MRDTTLKAIVRSYFAAFAAVVLFSNSFDWRFFFSTMEVDRRSWLIDHALPLWSYQYCGGTTRFGDPQAFGLSPLFIFPLIFGSYIGAKLLVIACSLAGFVYLKRCLVLATEYLGVRGLDQRETEFLATALSLFYVFGDYFIWNYYVGHVTYAPAFLLMPILYFTLVGLKRKLTPKEFAAGTFAAWCLYSSGFYVAITYFLLPFGIFALVAGFAALVWALVGKKAGEFFHDLSNIATASWFHALGILLGAYKFYGVYLYQSRYPRVVWSGEAQSFANLLISQLAPIVKEHHLFAQVTGHEQFWEYSFFNLILWLFLGVLALTVTHYKRFRVLTSMQRTFLSGLFFFIAWQFSLAMGDVSPHSPFVVFNAKLLRHSVRVPIRFQLAAILALSFAIIPVYSILPEKTRSLARKFAVLLTIAGLATFATAVPYLSVSSFVDRAKAGIIFYDSSARKMQRFSDGEQEEIIMSGAGDPNCYQPLIRETPPAGTGPLIIDPNDPRSEGPCSRESYFTQNELFISPACGPGVCLNIEALNHYAPRKPNVTKIGGRYCFVRPSIK